jgi:hypothetical protein
MRWEMVLLLLLLVPLALWILSAIFRGEQRDEPLLGAPAAPPSRAALELAQAKEDAVRRRLEELVQERPEAISVQPPAPKPPPLLVEAPVWTKPVLAPPPPAAVPAPAAPLSLPERPVGPGLAAVRALLGRRQAAAALVLREIFDRPLCQRRPGPPRYRS